MHNLGHKFSGIVLNQNKVDPDGLFRWRNQLSGNQIYQTFKLPPNYQCGTKAKELINPDLTGFSVLVHIDPGYYKSASLKYTMQWFNTQWVTIASGTTVGAQTDGKTWFDVIFDEPVAVTDDMLNAQFRFSITLPKGGASGEALDVPVPLKEDGSVVINNQRFTPNLSASIPATLTVGGSPGIVFGTGGGTLKFSWQEGVESIWTVPGTHLGEAFRSDGTTGLLGSGTHHSLNFRILGLIADSGINFLSNEYRSVVVRSQPQKVDKTLDTVKSGISNTFWMAPPQPSRFAVVSHYLDMRAGESAVVCDGVLIDPIIPNATFSVYYSRDDKYTSDQMSEFDWERKLWTRIPQTYHITQRRTVMFPNPVAAKYIKVEFSHLQAQSYDPGAHALPVRYKKFPSWVANYFIAQMQSPSYIADLVDVQYDALNFLYNYYLDDLTSEPDGPQLSPSDLSSQITNQDNGIDATTLNKIRLAINQFQQTPTANIDPSSILGTTAIQTGVSNQLPQTTEQSDLPETDLTAVSSTHREKVLFEQLMPVMYFYITCRHTYKELMANFEHNRAYFIGVNELSVIRNNYTVAVDESLYIESGADAANIEYSDFNVGADGVWRVY